MTESSRAVAVFELDAAPQHTSPLGTRARRDRLRPRRRRDGLRARVAARRGRDVHDARAEDQLPEAGVARAARRRRQGRSRPGARSGFVEGRVTDERGSLVAYATSTCMTLRGEAAAGSVAARVRQRGRIASWISATHPRRRPSGRRCASSSRRTSRASKQRGARRFEDADREWSRKLGEAGYAGLTWPKEYGGAGAPYSHQAIFLEELARAEAPSHLGVIGLGMAGPTIIAVGHRGAEGALPREDPERRGDLVPGLLGAGRRQRPRRGAHAHRGQGRPLPRQRPEGVVVVRAHRRLLHPRRPRRCRTSRGTRT